MNRAEDDFLRSLRATFAIEAAEHVQAIADGLLAVEKTSSDDGQMAIIETIYRHAHSLKGAARAVNLTDVESICQPMEDVFASWKRGELTPTPHGLDIVHRALDAVSKTIDGPTAPTIRPTLTQHVQALRKLKGVTSAQTRAEVTPSVSTQTPHVVMSPVITTPAGSADTVRIAITKLEACLLKAEEMLVAKLAATQHSVELRGLANQLSDWRKEWVRIQPELSVIRHQADSSSNDNSVSSLSKLANFLDWNQNYIRLIETKVESLARSSHQEESNVAKLVDDLLEDSKKLLMLPVSTVAPFLGKIVRDLCRDQGKEADFVMTGEEVEIDKRVLDEIKDPLIHIVRNCVDHGIETPDLRIRSNKSRSATITLTVSPVNGNKVEVEVSDDGAGIDVQRVKEVALKQELVTQREADGMSEGELQRLIFQSDLSTSAIITELSGRGLGLAIVRESTEKLGGTVSVETERYVGTKIRMTIPIALATFRGILVKVSDRLFVIPTAQVERVDCFKRTDVKTVENRETVVMHGRAVSLVRMADVLELPVSSTHEEPASIPVIVLGSNDQRMAFVVDAVVDEQEVLVKHFSKPLVRVRNVAGATVLGSGRVAPVLNVSDLLKSGRSRFGVAPALRLEPEERAGESKSILVAEDSITSRMLLKGILESAGYQVTTAVDGMEALTKLRTDTFDLLVSDVEMPRLDGFDLTARLRADKKFAELPVILVTALEKREDRERGVDVGANAYLVKSSFDQSNLLEAVRRLT
jgi:two-component system, chemotaxis family, sensor kinase CheA